MDELMIDGSFFYLIECQEYRQDVAGVVLDSYGRMIADEVVNGFDEATKQIDIERRSGKPILMYLQEEKRNRKKFYQYIRSSSEDGSLLLPLSTSFDNSIFNSEYII